MGGQSARITLGFKAIRECGDPVHDKAVVSIVSRRRQLSTKDRPPAREITGIGTAMGFGQQPGIACAQVALDQRDQLAMGGMQLAVANPKARPFDWY
ncbi:MAG: hypothetical protein ACFB6S_13485 [Geminicoccaceae bacterium]